MLEGIFVHPSTVTMRVCTAISHKKVVQQVELWADAVQSFLISNGLLGQSHIRSQVQHASLANISPLIASEKSAGIRPERNAMIASPQCQNQASIQIGVVRGSTDLMQQKLLHDVGVEARTLPICVLKKDFCYICLVLNHLLINIKIQKNQNCSRGSALGTYSHRPVQFLLRQFLQAKVQLVGFGIQLQSTCSFSQLSRDGSHTKKTGHDHYNDR